MKNFSAIVLSLVVSGFFGCGTDVPVVSAPGKNNDDALVSIKSQYSKNFNRMMNDFDLVLESTKQNKVKKSDFIALKNEIANLYNQNSIPLEAFQVSNKINLTETSGDLTLNTDGPVYVVSVEVWLYYYQVSFDQQKTWQDVRWQQPEGTLRVLGQQNQSATVFLGLSSQSMQYRARVKGDTPSVRKAVNQIYANVSKLTLDIKEASIWSSNGSTLWEANLESKIIKPELLQKIRAFEVSLSNAVDKLDEYISQFQSQNHSVIELRNLSNQIKDAFEALP